MFCAACGKQLGDGSQSCTFCGATLAAGRQTPVQNPDVPWQQPPYQPQPPSTTPWGKILLMIFGVVLLLAAGGIGGAIYIGYRAKGFITEEAKERGIDLEKLGEKLPPSKKVDPCSLLSKEEVAAALGVKIDRAEAEFGSYCYYFGEPAAVGKETPKAKTRAPEAAEEAKRVILRDLYEGRGAQLALGIDWEEGHLNLMAVRIALTFAGSGLATNLDGLGDQAMIGPEDSFLVFTKGGTSVTLDLRQIPKGREKTFDLAKKIEKRLE